MNKNSKKVIETVALIYIKNKKLLLVRPKSKKIFYMPGGKMDAGKDNLRYTANHFGEIKSSSEIDEFAYFSHGEYTKGIDLAPAVKLILRDLKKKGLVE